MCTGVSWSVAAIALVICMLSWQVEQSCGILLHKPAVLYLHPSVPSSGKVVRLKLNDDDEWITVDPFLPVSFPEQTIIRVLEIGNETFANDTWLTTDGNIRIEMTTSAFQVSPLRFQIDSFGYFIPRGIHLGLYNLGRQGVTCRGPTLSIRGSGILEAGMFNVDIDTNITPQSFQVLNVTFVQNMSMVIVVRDQFGLLIGNFSRSIGCNSAITSTDVLDIFYYFHAGAADNWLFGGLQYLAINKEVYITPSTPIVPPNQECQVADRQWKIVLPSQLPVLVGARDIRAVSNCLPMNITNISCEFVMIGVGSVASEGSLKPHHSNFSVFCAIPDIEIYDRWFYHYRGKSSIETQLYISIVTSNSTAAANDNVQDIRMAGTVTFISTITSTAEQEEKHLILDYNHIESLDNDTSDNSGIRNFSLEITPRSFQQVLTLYSVNMYGRLTFDLSSAKGRPLSLSRTSVVIPPNKDSARFSIDDKYTDALNLTNMYDIRWNSPPPYSYAKPLSSPPLYTDPNDSQAAPRASLPLGQTPVYFVLEKVEDGRVTTTGPVVRHSISPVVYRKFQRQNQLVIAVLALIPIVISELDAACDWWSRNQDVDKGIKNLEENLGCPTTDGLAANDRRFQKDDACGESCPFHPGANVCYRSIVDTFVYFAQCCYKISKGPSPTSQLLQYPSFGAGTMDIISPKNLMGVVAHLRDDVLSWGMCCYREIFASLLTNSDPKLIEPDSSCKKYYDKRPSISSKFYRPPNLAGRVFGDPHLRTLDGQEYTFNGFGEYVLSGTARSPNSLPTQTVTVGWPAFVAQARFFPLQQTSSASTLSNATVTVGAVFHSVDANGSNSSVVEIGVTTPTQNGLTINAQHSMNVLIVDGVSYTAAELLEMSASSGTILFKNCILRLETWTEDPDAPNNFLIRRISIDFPSIGSSASVFLDSVEWLQIQLFLRESDFKGRLVGLLGDWNGNASDDFVCWNATSKALALQPLSRNSSMQIIHFDFGETWRVASFESLFTYTNGKDFTYYNNVDFVPSFQPVFTTTEAELAAKAVCGTNVNCLFDVSATGNLSVANVSIEVAAAVAAHAAQQKFSKDKPVFNNTLNTIEILVNLDSQYSSKLVWLQTELNLTSDSPNAGSFNVVDFIPSTKPFVVVQYDGTNLTNKRSTRIEFLLNISSAGADEAKTLFQFSVVAWAVAPNEAYGFATVLVEATLQLTSTATPTSSPTSSPSIAPTTSPTSHPSIEPTTSPTATPSSSSGGSSNAYLVAGGIGAVVLVVCVIAVTIICKRRRARKMTESHNDNHNHLEGVSQGSLELQQQGVVEDNRKTGEGSDQRVASFSV